MGELIYQAIPAAMAEIGAIAKERKNSQQGYAYRGVDDVMNSAHPVLVKHRIFIAPKVLSNERSTTTNKNGTTLNYSVMTVQYTLFAEDGSHIEVTTIGEGMDSGDKASNKAMSVAFKYALFQLFCIPLEDGCDPEVGSYNANAVQSGPKASDLIAAINVECKRITEKMNAEEKSIFATNTIKPIIGGNNYTQCKDIIKLQKLLETVKEAK